MGMGGPSPSDIREKLKGEKEDKALVQQMRTDLQRLQSEAISRKKASLNSKNFCNQERGFGPYPLCLARARLDNFRFWFPYQPLYRFDPNA